MKGKDKARHLSERSRAEAANSNSDEEEDTLGEVVIWVAGSGKRN